MKSAFYVLSALVLLGSLGCVHSAHKVDGPQEKAEIPAGVRVGIGGKEVKEGDTVSVFTTSCHTTTMGEDRPRRKKECHDKQVGSALVLKILDHDSAIVSPQNGLVMDTSMKVEKQKGEQ
ncbi:MAG: hypothetical protein KF802_07775 [Bdellovibrionaceae bacterium]|nr:hypothetical protein [Pseudobdellovibrionaceae bacterium]